MGLSNLVRKLGNRSKNASTTDVNSIDQLHVYNALWSLPDHVSGMENSALRRMVDFQRHSSPKSMTLLTFNPRVDVTEAKERLVGEGRMNASTRIVNIWHNLRQATDTQLDAYTGATVTEPIPEATGTATDEAPHFTAHRDTNNRVIRRTYTRPDGTTLATHITAKNDKRFILHDTAGKPLTEWDTPDEFYRQWLKHTIVQQPAVLIIDDKKIGEFAHTIPGRTFNTVLFVHGSHLESAAEDPHGPILKARRNTIKNLTGFDLVVLQTNQQRDAIAARGIDTSNTCIIPSSLPSKAYTADNGQTRSANAGIAVSTLSVLKQVDHAIHAIRRAQRDGADVALTVCGDGVERDNLESLVEGLSLGDKIKLLGQVNDVPERLAASSFSLLTSTTEGHPLALIESMAAGCIPISYDINFGPRDIITHGVDGFIVPADDIDALANQIRAFLALPETEKEQMRRAAAQRALDYSSQKNTERWTSALGGFHTTATINEGAP